jgi:hypothetical protein
MFMTLWSENAHVNFCLKQDTIAIDRRITIGPRSCELIYRMPIRETTTEKPLGRPIKVPVGEQ